MRITKGRDKSQKSSEEKLGRFVAYFINYEKNEWVLGQDCPTKLSILHLLGEKNTPEGSPGLFAPERRTVKRN